VGEDGLERSFAGQLETRLSVPRKDVLEAIQTCWSSAKALRALRYGGEIGDVAVLVQPMLTPEAAGVAFSADPRTGERGVAVIEAVPSLADRLLDGAEDPESWCVQASDCRRERQLDREVLTEEQARRVAELAKAMDDLFGTPQDVEWAIQDGEVHLLQSRPITALPAAPVPIALEVPEGGWDRDDHHGVLSPLGWSWFQPYPDEMGKAFASAGAPIETMQCSRIGGQLYLRMVMQGGEPAKLPPRWVLWLAARLVPALRRANRVAEAFVDEEQFMQPLAEWRGGLRESLRAELEDIDVDDPRALSDEELLDRIGRAMALTEKGLRKHAWLHGPLVFGLGKLVLFVEDELGWSADRALSLVAGCSPSTTEMHRQLEAILRRHDDELAELGVFPGSWSSLIQICPELGRELGAWLADNRHRMLHYDPKHPTLEERPVYLLSILEGIFVSERRGSIDDANATSSRVDDALRDAEERLSHEAMRELRRLLELARAGYALREENGIDAVSRPTGLLRHFVLELGRRIESDIGAREHAVYLYAEEHGPALRREIDDIHALIELRRGEESWALHHRGPRRYGPPKPPSPPADVFPRGMARLLRILTWMESVSKIPEPSAGDGLKGIGIGSRVVRGRARVVRHPDQIAGLRHGEIVVCRITSPEWSVALGRVAALVTDEGGLLSHPAIIAREFDVSAVVGAEGATAKIATGDRIIVDPIEGTVVVQNSSGSASR
jgi:pyruvate,water dikinase